jgi:predicted nucleotidyltransferase
MITADAFKVILHDLTLSDQAIVRQYITDGAPFVFHDENAKYFRLRQLIANFFSTHPHSVFMIGSAKLGFSINPKHLWSPFTKDSDIDMVIVSSALFDEFWKDLYYFNIDLTVRSEDEVKQYHKFLKYFFRGWLRPDLFPFSYTKKDYWYEFFKKISYREFGDYKIRGAVFRDFDFYEKYHEKNISTIRKGDLI